MIEIELKDKTVISQLSQLQKVMSGADISRKIANILREESEDAFDNEHSPTGEKWQDLTSRYKKKRYKKGYNGNILQVTGDLVNSLDIDYGEDFALVGVAEKYGQYHQFGTKHMPARQFLGLGQDGINEIKAMLEKELKHAVSV